MTDEEKQIRVGHVMNHFIAGGYGADKDEQRQRIFLNDTAHVPVGLFCRALQVARQSYERDGVVPVGFVIKTAIKICHARDPGLYRSVTGGFSTPRWQRIQETSNVPPQLEASKP